MSFGRDGNSPFVAEPIFVQVAARFQRSDSGAFSS